MHKVPAFFDWRGDLSRWGYFGAGIYRGVISLLVVALDMGLHYMFGWTYEFADADAFWSIFESSLSVIAGFVLMLPIDIRRANDAGLSGWFVVLLWFLTLIPSPPEAAANEIMSAYLLVIGLPFIVMQLILQFKPGRAYRDWIRSNH